MREVEYLVRSTPAILGALLLRSSGSQAAVCGIRFGYNRWVKQREFFELNQAGMEGNPKMTAQ